MVSLAQVSYLPLFEVYFFLCVLLQWTLLRVFLLKLLMLMSSLPLKDNCLRGKDSDSYQEPCSASHIGDNLVNI